MSQNLTDLSPAQQVETASKAFEQEFERFVRFTSALDALSHLPLEAALAEERALSELRTRHLGKKRALGAAKKLIGRVAPAERPAFGPLTREFEETLLGRVDPVELK